MTMQLKRPTARAPVLLRVGIAAEAKLPRFTLTLKHIIQKRFLNSKLLAASILYPSVPRQGGSAPHATQNLGNRSGPARLMARTAAPASVAVKVLMEGNQISPVGIGIEQLAVAKNRPLALLIT